MSKAATTTSPPSSTAMWKLANAFMTGFFAYAARVQLNDPDWQVWFSGYAMAGMACLFVVLSSNSHWQGHVAESLTGAAILAFVAQCYVHKTVDLSPHTEVGRESSGILITMIWMAIVGFHSSSKAKSALTKSLSWMDGFLLVAAVGILLSVYLIPTYVLQANDTIEHCIGLGFGAIQDESSSKSEL